MASCEVVQDPEVRVRVPSGAVMHAALVDAVRTMARRRAMGDELAERMAAMTGASAALVESSAPAMLELTVHVGSTEADIAVAGISPDAPMAAAAMRDFEEQANSAQVTASIEAASSTASVRFAL